MVAKRILIVEDNEMNREVLTRCLERQGFEVLVAIDGRAGLRVADDEQPDLILMDLSMPEVDGWECARRLKAAPRTRAIPIIALSAHAMRGDREKALEAGCDEFDTKPLDFRGLLGKMDRLLQSPASVAI